ncbi:hypothetical protein NAB1_1732 [Lactiplantibacillus plantarum]|uniref:Acetyltransferase n=1 Tax=Lactiplantibacillus plantarum TaxID=1590 RepID=A0AAW3RHC7_LACPN|nr:hypothetical protein NAB1_1732 [Lactiplantibacillus plantarum]KZV04071.1 hypothetical protein NAB2_0998 [Lactiplantibacillus plantarum]
MQLQIRRFKTTDAPAAAALIARTLLTSNQGDYPKAYLDRLITQMTPAWLCQKAAATHFYVGYFQQQLVATGAIGSYWGRQVSTVCSRFLLIRRFKAWVVGVKFCIPLNRMSISVMPTV